MLDQPAPEEETATVSPAVAVEPHYVPPLKAEPLSGKVPLPRVKRFNRKMLAVCGLIGAAVITLAFSVGLQKPKKAAAHVADSTNRPPMPGAAVSSLPTSYKDYVQQGDVPQLGEPHGGDVGAMMGTTAALPAGSPSSTARQLTPLEQYRQQAELARLKAEDAARTANVAFAGGAAAVAPDTPRTGSNLDGAAAALSDRLLDVAQRTVNPTSGATTSGRDEANRQDDKLAFADKDRNGDFDLKKGVQLPRSPFTMFAGTVIPCVMTQGINSDLPGDIGCLVSQNVYDTVTGTHLLLPQGTRALGTYDSRISYGQSRVLVVWTRLLRPDGSWVSLEGMPGTDLSGYAGLTGHVNNHYVRLLTGVVLASVLGAGAQVAAGANNENPTFSQLAVQGAAENINQAGQQITRKNLELQPTIEVRPGARLNIFATKDIILPPFSG